MILSRLSWLFAEAPLRGSAWAGVAPATARRTVSMMAVDVFIGEVP
jgi:hypothetical protein